MREPHVENPVQLVRRWQLRRQLRACWAGSPGAELASLLTRLGLLDIQVLAKLQQATTFGAFWEWVLKNAPSLRVDAVPLSEALRVLPQLIRNSGGGAAAV